MSFIKKSIILALFIGLPVPVLALDIPAGESLEDIADTATQPVSGLRKKFKKNVEIQEEDAVSTPENNSEINVVVLRGLNKVIGRVSKFEVPLGTLARFENLEIIARKCWKSQPDERPENAALLEIREIKSGETPKQVFLGWMLSSSPAISSLEHPVYDITVLSCEHRKNLEAN